MDRSFPRLFLIALALILAPTASAAIGSFGTHVTDTNADTVYTLDTTSLTSVVLIDEDGDQRPDVGEPILLLKSGTYVHTTAVRLAYPVAGQAGGQVQSGDADAGLSGISLSGQLAYLDMDADQVFTPGDYLFYDLAAAQQGQVSVGDLYLTGPRAGEVVTSASNLVSRSLAAVSGSWAVDDRDSNGFDQGDRVYIDADGDGRISVADVRVGVDTATLFGTWAPVDASRITLPLATNNPPTTFVISDTDEDGKVDPGEPVYLSRSATQLLAGSVRLHAPVSGEVGTLVKGGDSDLGINVVALSGTLSFDGTGTIGQDEPLIFDHDGAGSGTGDINELILSGQEAGSLIDSGSPHEQASLTVAPGTISYLDTDGDGSFGLQDILYLDADDDGFVSAGDVQLSGWVEEDIQMADPEAQEPQEDDEPADDEDPTEDPEPEPTPDNSSDDEPAGPSDSDGDGVPDSQDACPNHAADTADGCPIDADGDGVPDDQDDCPNVAAVTEDGCPPDADGDGVFDRDDACPDQAGDQADGCPEPASPDDGNATDGEQEEDQQGSPGPGPLVVLAALSGMALALSRRRAT